MHLSPSGSVGCRQLEGGGSVVIDLFYVAHIVCGGSVLLFVLVCITLCLL